MKTNKVTNQTELDGALKTMAADDTVIIDGKMDCKNYYGRKIEAARFVDGEKKDMDRFLIEFTDGVTIALTDNGQSCCESRYMKCDDNLKDLVGGKLESIEIVKVDDVTPSYFQEKHQVAFIKISTDKGSITINTHVEHNGYYGGFILNIAEVR